MKERSRREPRVQPAQEIARIPTLGRAECRGVPLVAFRIVGGDESWLAAHGEPHIARLELRVDRLS
jgi:hypothetical protein